MERLGFVVLVGLPVGYVAAQTLALRRWRGGWRLAAGLPLPPWLVWAALLARDLTADPTSHNLFPFEILIGAAAALTYLAALAGARRLAAVRAPGRRTAPAGRGPPRPP